MYVGWRELRWAKGRFALIGSVIVLISVLIGLLSGLTRGLAEQSTSAVTGLDAESLIFAADSFDSSVLADDAVPGATPLGFATVRGTGPSGSVPVEVIGVPEGSTVAPDAQAVRSGSVVLSRQAEDELGSGDLSLAGQRFSVAGAHGEASYSHLPVVWMEFGDWQRLNGMQGQATVLAQSSAGPDSTGQSSTGQSSAGQSSAGQSATGQSATGQLPAGLERRSIPESLSAIGSYSSENGSLTLIRGFLIVISALVVGAFFTVWMFQRAADIAVLKALGASTGSLLLDSIGEAAVLLVGATVIGALISLGLAPVAGAAVPFSLDLAALAGPLALLVLLGLGGAGLAVRRVTSVDPLTALAGK